MSDLLPEIIECLESSGDALSAGIDGSKVRVWLASNDLEVLGATYALVPDKLQFSMIAPPIEFDDFVNFIKHYLGRCIIENPDSEWAHSRYEAARDVVGWFLYFWNDKKDRKIVGGIKDWICDLYLNGSEDVKKCLVHGALEHLFERKDVLDYFYDWKSSSELRRAYDEAVEWSKN